jgi:hypothetical protein
MPMLAVAGRTERNPDSLAMVGHGAHSSRPPGLDDVTAGYPASYSR